MRRTALALLVCACASHRESAVQVDTSLEKQTESHAAESLEIHRIEEPSRTVTTVEEYAAPEGNGAPTGAPPVQDGPRAIPVVLPFHGPLIKLTTITEDRGPIHVDTSAKGSSESTGAATATLAGKADTEKDSKPSLGLPVLGLVLAALAASAILTRGIWLGPLAALAKRLLSGGVQ